MEAEGLDIKSLEVDDIPITGKEWAKKNYLINGNFDIWQRNTSQTSSGYGSDDRWFNANNTSTKTNSQQSFDVGQTNVPNNPTYYSRTEVITGGTPSSAVYKIQRIESVTTLAGETATLSFWAKANSSKNIAVEFYQNFGDDATASASVEAIGVTTCALTTSWQQFTVTVDIPSISGKVVGDNSRLAVVFWFDAGTNYTLRTNGLVNQSGTFDLAQIQLEKGSVETDFEERSIVDESLLCYRYYEEVKMYIESGANTTHYISGKSNFIIPMRTTPTITYTDRVGNDSKITERRDSAATDNVSPSVAPAAPDNTRVSALHRNLGSALDGFEYYWFADAEI